MSKTTDFANLQPTQVVETDTNGNLEGVQLDHVTIEHPTFENTGDTVGSEPSGTFTVDDQGSHERFLGRIRFRGSSNGQVLDIKTNQNSNSCMFQFVVKGYMYNQGNFNNVLGGYMYTNNSIINVHTQALGNANNTLTVYRSSDGFLCLKMNRGTSGYSEGYVNIYFHSHDTSRTNGCEITNFAGNNSTANYF